MKKRIRRDKHNMSLFSNSTFPRSQSHDPHVGFPYVHLVGSLLKTISFLGLEKRKKKNSVFFRKGIVLGSLSLPKFASLFRRHMLSDHSLNLCQPTASSLVRTPFYDLLQALLDNLLWCAPATLSWYESTLCRYHVRRRPLPRGLGRSFIISQEGSWYRFSQTNTLSGSTSGIHAEHDPCVYTPCSSPFITKQQQHQQNHHKSTGTVWKRNLLFRLFTWYISTR